MLSSYLPDFIIENRTLYSILSKGIHDLNEEDCLSYFPLVKTGIELILDAKLEDQEKRKKTENASMALAKLHGKLQEIIE